MKHFIVLGVVVLLIIGAYFFIKNTADAPVATEVPAVVVVEDKKEVETVKVPEVPEVVVDETKTVIGVSATGNPITAYHYGSGDAEVLFVGGVHGGYSWNTALLAYELMEYLETNPNAVPEGVRVTVVPVLNPDGLIKVTGTTGMFEVSDVSADQKLIVDGRFNANRVDLNRNFDCEWNAEGTWQDKTVSGGAKVFSEQESIALRDYVLKNKPDAAVVWYSAAGGVYASNCHDGVLPETDALTQLYAKASGYQAFKDFDYYEITGDMVNWLAKEEIPAISVLLTNHTSIEWEKNKLGIEAVLKRYAE
jgi:hypothetical protein